MALKDAQPLQYVSARLIPIVFNKGILESEADLDAYLAALKKAYGSELKNKKHITLWNQSALKTFARDTRRKLRELIGARLDYVLTAETAELRQQAVQVGELRTALKAEGRDELIERVAYTLVQSSGGTALHGCEQLPSLWCPRHHTGHSQ